MMIMEGSKMSKTKCDLKAIMYSAYDTPHKYIIYIWYTRTRYVHVYLNLTFNSFAPKSNITSNSYWKQKRHIYIYIYIYMNIYRMYIYSVNLGFSNLFCVKHILYLNIWIFDKPWVSLMCRLSGRCRIRDEKWIRNMGSHHLNMMVDKFICHKYPGQLTHRVELCTNTDSTNSGGTVITCSVGSLSGGASMNCNSRRRLLGSRLLQLHVIIIFVIVIIPIFVIIFIFNIITIIINIIIIITIIIIIIIIIIVIIVDKMGPAVV